jgi:hypothetical protein
MAAARGLSTRRGRWLAVLGAVLLAHAVTLWWFDDAIIGWDAGRLPMPQRMEVAFVRTLEPAAPPAVAARPPAPAAPRPRPRRVPAPAVPASARAPVEAAASGPAEIAAAAPKEDREPAGREPPALPPVAAASAVMDAASAAVAAAQSAASAASAVPPFEWPPSTRLSYALAGNYRGELHGSARVQWLRAGPRYQVHLDVVVGPSFAPLLSRNMTSDGELGDEGLVPRRYDEATKLPFQSPRRVTMLFTPETVTLGNGSTRPALPGVQDTASQFVQMTWLFTTRPELLRVGNSITVPLALPRRVDRWVYDVLSQEKLYTPMGEIDTFHLKPRRAEQRPRGELSAEVWFAPTLQYLPVRIRLQQDADTFIDLMLDAVPLQAAPEAGPR